MKLRNSRRMTRLLSFSPWILGAACILLLLVIAFFALSNFQREKNLIKSAIEQKGLTLVRFINSTVGGSVRAEMMRSSSYTKWEDYMMPALELAVEQPGVDSIRIVDKNGKILLSVGQDVKADTVLDPQTLSLLKNIASDSTISYETVILPRSENHERKALFVSLYSPSGAKMRHSENRRGPMMGGRFWRNGHFNEFSSDMERLRGLAPVYLVQLDLEQFSAPLRRQVIQIVLELAAIILVGIGGTLSFYTLKGLRGSEKDLGKVTVFNKILVSSLPVGLIATDENGAVQVVNEAAEKMTGIVAGDCIGKQARESLLEPLSDLLIAERAKTGAHLQREIVLERGSDGQGRVLDVNIVPVKATATGSAGEVMLLRDLTKVKRLEQELQRSERLAAVGKMAAGVAHELRNPLSSIKGLALILKSKFRAESEAGETADTLVREVERLNRSIGELLDYAKPGSLECEPAGIATILEKTLSLVEPDLLEMKIAVEKEIDPDVPQVLVDPDKIRQVLLNILLNSLQAMEEKVDGRKLKLRVHQDGGEIVVSIEDNGPGIQPDAIKKVFDPYFTTKNSGTGLGLAISLKIIEEHGGRLEVASEAGRYARFQLFLPAA